jgi:hypothetical protein
VLKNGNPKQYCTFQSKCNDGVTHCYSSATLVNLRIAEVIFPRYGQYITVHRQLAMCWKHRRRPILCDPGFRRLFLRAWRPSAPPGTSETPSINVEIWVRYEHSTAEKDELSDVLDYNVMRDALLCSGYPHSRDFVERALDELMKSPIEAAYVEVVHGSPGRHWRGSRYRARSGE